MGFVGCGKLIVLCEVCKCFEEERMMVCVMVLIGIVVFVICGMIIWFFVGWILNFIRIFLEDFFFKDFKDFMILKWFLKVNVIIIDEISMIENNFFERFDFLLRYI